MTTVFLAGSFYFHYLKTSHILLIVKASVSRFWQSYGCVLSYRGFLYMMFNSLFLFQHFLCVCLWQFNYTLPHLDLLCSVFWGYLCIYESVYLSLSKFRKLSAIISLNSLFVPLYLFSKIPIIHILIWWCLINLMIFFTFSLKISLFLCVILNDLSLSSGKLLMLLGISYWSLLLKFLVQSYIVTIIIFPHRNVSVIDISFIFF